MVDYRLLNLRLTAALYDVGQLVIFSITSANCLVASFRVRVCVGRNAIRQKFRAYKFRIRANQDLHSMILNSMILKYVTCLNW